MTDYGDELSAQIARFKEETGLSDSDISRIAEDRYSYDADELAEIAAEDGISEQEQRALVAESTLMTLTNEESTKIVKSLREDVGFTPEQIVTILEDAHEFMPDLLAIMKDDLKQTEVLVKVGGVSTDDLTELLEGKPVDEKLGILEETFNGIFNKTFPDFDWDEATLMLDEATKFTDLDVNDPKMAELTGDPATDKVVSFADRVKNRQSDDKQR